MRHTITKIITLALVMGFMFYLCFSFSQAGFDITIWEESARNFCAAMFIVSVLISVFIITTGNDDDDYIL